MDNRLKKEIEWHFMNYEADKARGAEEIIDISEQCLVASYGKGTGRSGVSKPTENAALRTDDILVCYYWSRVVENVKIAFEPEIQGEIIKDKFNPDRKQRLRYNQLVAKYGGDNANRSVFDYRYDKIMNLAEWWAQHYGLIRIKNKFNFKRTTPDN